jgi:hypothetical protein
LGISSTSPLVVVVVVKSPPVPFKEGIGTATAKAVLDRPLPLRRT